MSQQNDESTVGLQILRMKRMQTDTRTSAVNSTCERLIHTSTQFDHYTTMSNV